VYPGEAGGGATERVRLATIRRSGRNGDAPRGTGGRPFSLDLISSGNASCLSPVGWLRLTCEHDAYAWQPLRCRRCDGCFEAKKRLAIYRIGYGAVKAAWVSFVTLTTLPSMEWSVLLRRFQSLVKALRHEFGSLEYVAVKEEGGLTGMKHLHVLLTGAGARWIPYERIQALWEARSSAWNVDIRRVNNLGGVGAYLAKYIAKAMEFPRSINFSRGWPTEEKKCWQDSQLDAGPDTTELQLTDRGFYVPRELLLDCKCFGVTIELVSGIIAQCDG